MEGPGKESRGVPKPGTTAPWEGGEGSPAKTYPTDNLEAIAARFLEAFQSKKLPKQRARLFFAEPSEAIPCRRWSVRNRFITLIERHDFARAFRRWRERGRLVQKGEHAFFVSVPPIPS